MDHRPARSNVQSLMDSQDEPATFNDGNIGQISTQIHYTENASNNLPPLSESVTLHANNESGAGNGMNRYSSSSHGGAIMHQYSTTSSIRYSKSELSPSQMDKSQALLRGDEGRRGGLGTPSAPLVQHALGQEYETQASSNERAIPMVAARNGNALTLAELDSAASSHNKDGSSASDDVNQDGSEYESADDDCDSEYSAEDANCNTSAQSQNLPKPFNKKNLKRHRLSHSETRFLLNQFGQNPHPDASQRAMLAKQIKGLTARQIQVWFQNRRAKLKRMSAADADRMLSTRSYPEGYGPQGFENRMGMGRDRPQQLPYVQPVEGVYASNGHEYQAAYSPRTAPPENYNYTTGNQEPYRGCHANPVYPAQDSRHVSTPGPHSSEFVPHHYDSVRAAQAAQYEASASRSEYARSPMSHDRSPVSSHGPVTPLNHVYGRPLRSPAHLGLHVPLHRNDTLNEAQYPRSIPIEPGFIPITESSSSYLQPHHSSLTGDRDSQNRSPLPRYPSPLLQKGDSSQAIFASQTPIAVSPGSRFPIHQYDSQQQVRYNPHGGPSGINGPIGGFVEHSRPGNLKSPGYSDVRHFSQDRQVFPVAQSDRRLPVMTRDQQYYYGSEEHIRHEKEELEIAKRVYAEQQAHSQQNDQEHYAPDVVTAQNYQLQQDEQLQRSQYVPADYTQPPAEIAATRTEESVSR